MSLLTALNPGLTGILSQQKQVEITGNNIANVNTPGYSRQTADLTPKAAVQIQGLFIGQGVNVEDVRREYDAFVTGQLKDQNSVLGEESAKSGPLAELERIFGIGEDSLASEIEDFFGAWQDLSKNPSGAVEREQVVYKGQNLLESFDQTQSDLVTASKNIDNTLDAEVNGINLKLRELADLNADIKQKEALGHEANTDQDKRDLLVKELSKTLGIQTFHTGSSQIGAQLPGGIPLVEGDHAVELQSYYEDGSLNLQIKSGDIILPADVNNFGGKFKGLLEIRDKFIPELQNRVRSLEYEITTQDNAQHEAGYGLDGQTGRAFFTKQTSWQSQNGFEDPADLAFQTGDIAVEVDGQTTANITIAQGENSLNGIRDAINRADAGVLASVVPDSDGYHLDLTPQEAGGRVSLNLSLSNSAEQWTLGGFTEQANGIFESDNTFSDPDAHSFNEGTISIAIDGGPPVDVDIDAPGENTLNGIRDAINASGTGVHASIEETSGGQYRLDVKPPENSLDVTADVSGAASIHDSFSSSTEAVFGQGTLTFTTAAAGDVTVNVADGSSLEDVKQAVNTSVDAGNAGIHADIEADGNNYQLSFAAYEPMTITPGLGDNETYNFSSLVENPGSDENRVAIQDTGEIAAAGATQGAPGDNENALAIHSLASQPLVDGDKTFVDGYSRIASLVGTETRRNTMARDGASDAMDQLENQRESIVGVSIEEEMMNLIQFQKGFEASTQYMKTIDEMLGTIIGMRR